MPEAAQVPAVRSADNPAERYYSADPHEASWASSSSRTYCSLSHEVPYYGMAVFERHAGGELNFRLRVKQTAPKANVAHLASVPPEWKHGALIRDLGEVQYSKGNIPFSFQQALARRLLTELSEGMFPTLLYTDWDDERDNVTVALSAVNVRSALGEFLDCNSQLFPYAYKDINDSQLYFEFGKYYVPEGEKWRLDQIIEYLNSGAPVKKIQINGYTDKVGIRRYNRWLSTRRVETVRNYLVAQGVPAKIIKVKAHGERRPVYNNRTVKGRSLNRRVDIFLTQ